MWLEQGFAAMFRSVLAELNIGQHIIKHEDGERRLTNLLHLGELLQEESQYHREGTRSLLHWLARKREDNTTTREEEQMRLESDEELVKIVTMHKSKGLQYSVVFCPFLWYGPKIQEKGQPLVYHHPNDQENTYLDLKGKGDPDRAQKRYLALREDLAESLRLAYVAMTRAEHCLYLTWQFANASEYSALCYLLQDSLTSLDLLKAKVGDGDSIDWSGDEIHFAIEQLCEEHPELFMLEKSPESTESGQLQLPGLDEELPKSSVRSFNRQRPVTTSYQLSSFSSLSSWMKEEDPDLPDYDQFSDVTSVEPSASAKQEKDMFSFPKGPQPGTCIHHIFEEIEFSNYDGNEDIIEESLIRHGIDQQWSDTVSSMLETVLQKPLLESSNTLKLAALGSEVLIPEMEFYFKNSDIETAKLISIIRGEQTIENEHGGTGSGFLKGFIDLTFKFGDKYYLLDYKTNYLGDSYQDYQQKNLTYEMREASYDLQYHIYTIALHRFLKKRVPQYSYEQHFGGAFYLFLRGMNTTGREGIYFDCPEWSVIQKLNDYLSGGINE
jgi:exodeoxyribonuclease V beta subunit